MEYTKSAALLQEAVREEKAQLIERVANVDSLERQVLTKNLNNFFRKMETLSAHIDRFHSGYQRVNELTVITSQKSFPRKSSRDEYK